MLPRYAETRNVRLASLAEDVSTTPAVNTSPVCESIPVPVDIHQYTFYSAPFKTQTGLNQHQIMLLICVIFSKPHSFRSAKIF